MNRKHYSAPAIEVVEANLASPILAGSYTSNQVEDGVWSGLDNTTQVEDGVWSGLDYHTQVEDGVWSGL